MRAFIGLGSNVGQRRENIERAIELLGSSPEVAVLQRASWYETEPVGLEEQRWFINTAVEVETELAPRELLRRLKEIEGTIGRRERGRWGPREVDLDLLLQGDLIIEEETLVLPHPQLHRRRFALEPLCELAPELVHPRLGRPFWEFLAELDERKRVIRLG